MRGAYADFELHVDYCGELRAALLLERYGGTYVDSVGHRFYRGVVRLYGGGAYIDTGVVQPSVKPKGDRHEGAARGMGGPETESGLRTCLALGFGAAEMGVRFYRRFVRGGVGGLLPVGA